MVKIVQSAVFIGRTASYNNVKVTERLLHFVSSNSGRYTPLSLYFISLQN